ECGRIENAAPEVRGCQMPSRLGWPDSVRGGLKVFAFSKSIFVASPARLPAPAGVIFGAAVWATASASSGKTITMVTRSKANLMNRKSTRLNSSHGSISYAVFCLKKKKTHHERQKQPYGRQNTDHHYRTQ